VECEITPAAFRSEVEAEAAMVAMGWQGFAFGLDVTADEDLHWHDTDSVAYVISGTARTRLEDGTVLEADAGSRVFFPAGLVHQDVAGTHYRVLLSFPIDPSDLSQPFNKPLPVSLT
jgi:quercetin dioxygenase-like cupin family protein